MMTGGNILSNTIDRSLGRDVLVGQIANVVMMTGKRRLVASDATFSHSTCSSA